MKLITDRYQEDIIGVISCFDRIIITGTLPQLCFAQGMTSYLYEHQIRIFDYARFVEPFRDELRDNAQRLAEEHGVEIFHVRKKSVRKETLVQEQLARRGTDEPGLVCIISTMETCQTYIPWHDKKTHKTYLRGHTSQCLHYYYYGIDEEIGLYYVRVPTWCPFKLQIYFNGHNWLANQLKQADINYQLIDNAFVKIDDIDTVQQLANELNPETLHRIFDRMAATFCPVHAQFNQDYHWSIHQAEYATDIIFKDQDSLQPLYDQLVKTAIHTVKPDNIATFLGRKLDPRYLGEMGNNYQVRIEGQRIKHHMGKVSIKMYDKFGHVLRIETTTNDVSFFKHYRTVEHRDGSTSQKNAAMKKSIYSLNPLQQVMQASNQRYLKFVSAFDDQTSGIKQLEKISQPVIENERRYKGFNFFDPEDLTLLVAIMRGEFNIYGFQNKHLKAILKTKSTGQISRILKRLCNHGLIKKVRNTYKYYLTVLGRMVITTALKIKSFIIIPQLELAN